MAVDISFSVPIIVLLVKVWLDDDSPEVLSEETADSYYSYLMQLMMMMVVFAGLVEDSSVLERMAHDFSAFEQRRLDHRYGSFAV
jgi:di/tricarboxylate transporter